MGKLVRWTEKEDKYLKKNAKILTSKQIGQALGRSQKGVIARASLLKISLRKIGDNNPSRKYSTADIDLAQQLYNAGMKPRHIAEKLEIPAGTLGNYFY
jgi:hypothetical protein